jgi:predicted peroxiredoxin
MADKEGRSTMANGERYMLYVGSHGVEDPSRAGLILTAAIAAQNNNVQAKVALLGDAVLLMNQDIAEQTKLPGRAPGGGPVKLGTYPIDLISLRELVMTALNAGVEILC